MSKATQERCRDRKSHALDMTIEHLEQRRMLTGNVEVSVTGGGDLIIEGDNQDNRIVMEASDTNPNLFIVRGTNGTTINGSSESFEATGLTDDVRINLGSGNNKLEILGSQDSTSHLPDDLIIELGTSTVRNNVKLRDLLVEGDMSVRGGEGRDDLTSGRTNFGGRVRIDTRGGADDMTIEGLFGPDPNAGERVDIRTGSGDDYVFLRYDDLERVNIDTGDGDDYIEIYDVAVERVSVRTGNGDDEVEVGSAIGSTFVEELSINTGSGNDQVELDDFANSESTFTEVDINTGRGDDEVVVEQVSVDSGLNIRTGSGVDSVRLEESNFSYDVRLGSGDDHLFLDTMNLTGGSGSVNGNSGIDTLTPIDSIIPEMRSIEGN